VAVAIHYRLEFGTDEIYILPSRPEENRLTADRMSIQNQGKILFGKTASYPAMATELARGGQIITTKLTEKFTLEQFTQKHGHRAMLLFAVDKTNRLHVYAHDCQINPEPGWSLVYMLKNGEDTCPHLKRIIQQLYYGVSKNAVLRLFFLHSFWIHHEKTVNILVHCWDHENKP